MDEELLRSIDKKLDTITKLLAGNLIQGQNKTDAIKRLCTSGMEATAIADVVGTTAGTVHARLSELRKKSPSKTKKTKKAVMSEEEKQ